jgi:hypothetical protein
MSRYSATTMCSGDKYKEIKNDPAGQARSDPSGAMATALLKMHTGLCAALLA